MIVLKTYKIYTAGKMGGLSYEDQMYWRHKLEDLVKERTYKSVEFVHPPEYYTYGAAHHKTNHEVRMWDLSQVKSSDVVVFDLTTISDSIGTLMELATVDAMNQFGYKSIYAIGVGSADTDHPWVEDCLLRREDTLEDAADYIARYLLV